MLQVKTYDVYGVYSSVHQGDIGDQVPWHVHKNTHGHYVIRGRTKVEIESQPDQEWTADKGNLTFPSNVRHQITILNPDTVFVHTTDKSELQAAAVSVQPVADPEPLHGGVMLEDGTIVR